MLIDIALFMIAVTDRYCTVINRYSTVTELYCAVQTLPSITIDSSAND